MFTLRAGDGASHPVSPGVRVTAIAAFSRYLEEEQRSFLLSAAEAAPLLTALNREADLQLTLELAPPLGEASLIPPRLRLLLTPPD